MSSAASAGCSSHGDCQVTEAVSTVRFASVSAIRRADASARSAFGARTVMISSRALAKFC